MKNLPKIYTSPTKLPLLVILLDLLEKLNPSNKLLNQLNQLLPLVLPSMLESSTLLTALAIPNNKSTVNIDQSNHFFTF